MQLGGSLPHSQQSTTCPYPSQINPFLCPSHFWQVQLVSFLIGLRTYQQLDTYDPQISRFTIRLYRKKNRGWALQQLPRIQEVAGSNYSGISAILTPWHGFLQSLQDNGGSGRSCTTFSPVHNLQFVVSFLSTKHNLNYLPVWPITTRQKKKPLNQSWGKFHPIFRLYSLSNLSWNKFCGAMLQTINMGNLVRWRHKVERKRNEAGNISWSGVSLKLWQWLIY